MATRKKNKGITEGITGNDLASPPAPISVQAVTPAPVIQPMADIPPAQPIQVNPITALPPPVALNYGQVQQGMAVRPYNPCDFGLCINEPASSQQNHGMTTQDVGFINHVANGGGGGYWQGLKNAFTAQATRGIADNMIVQDRNQLAQATHSPAFADAFGRLTAAGATPEQAQHMALAQVGGVNLVASLPAAMGSLTSAQQQAVDVANNRAALTNTDATIAAPGQPQTLQQTQDGLALFGLNGQVNGVPAQNLTPGGVQQMMAHLGQGVQQATADQSSKVRGGNGDTLANTYLKHTMQQSDKAAEQAYKQQHDALSMQQDALKAQAEREFEVWKQKQLMAGNDADRKASHDRMVAENELILKRQIELEKAKKELEAAAMEKSLAPPPQKTPAGGVTSADFWK